MAAVWFVLLTHRKYKQNPVSFIQGWPKMFQNCEPCRCWNPENILQPRRVYSRRYLGVLRSSRKVRDIQEQQITGPDRLPVYLWHFLRLSFFGHPPSNPARGRELDPLTQENHIGIRTSGGVVVSRVDFFVVCKVSWLIIGPRFLIMGWFADFSSPNPWSLPSDMVAFPRSI